MTEDPKEQHNVDSRQVKPSSETQPRITNNQKEKDPRRVAAGKRLAAISRMAKEKKREQHQRSEEHEQESTNSESYINKDNFMMILAGVGVISGLYLLTRRQNNVKESSDIQEVTTPMTVKVQREAQPKESTRDEPKSNPKGLISLDD